MEGTIYAAIATGSFGLLGFFFTKYLERKSVSTAILAEIQRLLLVIDEHLGHWRGWIEDKETQKHPLIPFSYDVYQKHENNLGLVKPKYVGMVVRFYGYLKFVNSFQNLRDKYHKDKNDDAFNNIYSATLERITSDFGGAFDNAFKKYGLTKQIQPTQKTSG